MDSLWIELASVAGAAVAGIGLGVWLVRSGERASAPVSAASAIDGEDMEPLIEYAAQRWATACGRPEAAGLVAEKLRTLYGIRYGKRTVPTRRRWWSR